MKKIIDPVSKEILKSQLTQDKLLRTTNHGGNEIYVVDNENAPDVIREIGRLREEAFRAGGGGTGLELDIDKFDTDAAYGYKQLVLWDPEAERIIGGYRYVLCDDIVYDKHGQPILTSSHMFRFSKKFIKDYIPGEYEIGAIVLTYKNNTLINVYNGAVEDTAAADVRDGKVKSIEVSVIKKEH